MARQPPVVSLLLGRSRTISLPSGPAIVIDYVMHQNEAHRPAEITALVEDINGDVLRVAAEEVLRPLVPVLGVEEHDASVGRADEEVWRGLDTEAKQRYERRARDLVRMHTGDEFGHVNRGPRSRKTVDPRFDPETVSEALRVERTVEDIRARTEKQPLKYRPSSLRAQLGKLKAANGSAAALVHGNTGRLRSPLDNVPQELRDAIERYVRREVDEERITRDQHKDRLSRYLREEKLQVDRSDDALLTLLDLLSQGHNLYAATPTKRSVNARPNRALGSWNTMTPYEHLQLDATPIDLFCLDQYGKLMTTVYLLVAKCVALRKTVAMRLVAGPHPFNNRAVRGLLWDCIRGRIAPDEFTRPGASALPSSVELMVHKLGTVNMDRGPQFNCNPTLASLNRLGIRGILDDPGSGYQKPHVEADFGGFTRGLFQGMPGHKGANVRERGVSPEAGPLLTQPIVLQLLWWFVDEVKHKTPTKGLRLPTMPEVMLTPAQAELEYMRTQGRMRVQADLTTVLSLFEHRQVAFGRHGLQLRNRRYDGEALKPLHDEGIHYGERGRPGTRLDVFYDDHEPHRVLVRLPHGPMRWVRRVGSDSPELVLQDQLERDLHQLVLGRALSALDGEQPRVTNPRTVRVQILDAAHEAAEVIQRARTSPVAPAAPVIPPVDVGDEPLGALTDLDQLAQMFSDAMRAQ